jgi:hypothetical protein
MKYLLKRFVLTMLAALALVLGGCATSHEMVEAEKRLDQVETVLDAERRDLDAVRTQAVRKIDEAEKRIKTLEMRPIPAPQTPGLSTTQVEAIARVEAAKAAAVAFAAGKVVDASTLATKTDVDAVVAKLSADIAGITPAAAPPAVPAPAKFSGILENWPSWPHLAGIHLGNGYDATPAAERAAWLVELKAANPDTKFGCWVDSVIK